MLHHPHKYTHTLAEAAQVIRRDERLRHVHFMATWLVQLFCYSKEKNLNFDPRYYFKDTGYIRIRLRAEDGAWDWETDPMPYNSPWQSAYVKYYDIECLKRDVIGYAGVKCRICGNLHYRSRYPAILHNYCLVCAEKMISWWRRRGFSTTDRDIESDELLFLAWVVAQCTTDKKRDRFFKGLLKKRRVLARSKYSRRTREHGDVSLCGTRPHELRIRDNY